MKKSIVFILLISFFAMESAFASAIVQDDGKDGRHRHGRFKKGNHRKGFHLFKRHRHHHSHDHSKRENHPNHDK